MLIQTIKSDNALELGSSHATSSFLAEHGIIHQTTCLHTLQHNGVIERKYRILLEAYRALLFQSKRLASFWGNCLLTATYFIKKIPSRLLQNRSPCEVLYGKPLDYSHLRVFGCLSYSTVLIPQRDKLQPRAIPCSSWGTLLPRKVTNSTISPPNYVLSPEMSSSMSITFLLPHHLLPFCLLYSLPCLLSLVTPFSYHLFCF